MPLVSEFFGIKIYMYWADHFPEYFHAEYGEYKALVRIREAAILKGLLPAKQLKLVLAWDLSGCFDPANCIDMAPETIYSNGVSTSDPLAEESA